MPDQIRRLKDHLTAGVLALLGLVLATWNLGLPKGFIFDEVYYAKDAHSLLLHGVELDAKGLAEFVVHPPVGKWLIAGGIKIFGFNEFGWRISSAIFGSLAIWLIYFVAKRLFNNYLVSTTCAALMVLDGLHLVHSRTALLDIFLMFFVLLGFYFLLNSWNWAAGLALGLALGVKWSALYYIVAFFSFVLYSDYRTELAQEISAPLKQIVRSKLLKRSAQFGIIPLAAYIASWTGWFLTSNGWDRTHSKQIINSFFYYHSQIFTFHTNLTERHSYQANPWSWLIQSRPTSFFYATPTGCGTNSCSQEILALGTPLLWWSGIAAIAITFGYWIARREWQSGLLLLALAAGYLPWFLMQKRTTFSFYSIIFEPYLILIIGYVAYKFLESSTPDSLGGLVNRQRALLGYIAVIALCFLYFLPIFMGITTTYGDWLNRMWLPSWI